MFFKDKNSNMTTSTKHMYAYARPTIYMGVGGWRVVTYMHVNNQQICRSFSKIFRFVIFFKHFMLTMLNSCKNIDHAIDVKKEKEKEKKKLNTQIIIVGSGRNLISFDIEM